MEKAKISHINRIKINSNHNSDDELGLDVLIVEEISWGTSKEIYEFSNTVQGWDNQDSILSNNGKMINQENERKNYQGHSPHRINDFSKRGKKKIILLYGHPKIDQPSPTASYMRSRIFKQYISHRTKMNTQRSD
ncbi:unnamed protein product [Paramecium octaurelia]|uniref:Uncharacterized protein n=1 Tax=Paramecium octaurelia TaxID=43137 RepID=A0A8S1XLR3_PAROT|nr:unnamed protein product [Paramecium octaurelia]